MFITIYTFLTLTPNVKRCLQRKCELVSVVCPFKISSPMTKTKKNRCVYEILKVFITCLKKLYIILLSEYITVYNPWEKNVMKSLVAINALNLFTWIHYPREKFIF